MIFHRTMRGMGITKLLGVLAIVALVAAPLLAQGAASPPAKPHIVLFISDDHSWHDVGAYGATDVRTPNLDKLASEGMKFEYAIAASPTCSPSRAAMFTGQYPMRNGAHANHSLIREGVKTLPSYMKELGYRVVIAGKTHIGPREQFPFEYLKESNVMPPGKKHVLWTDLNTNVIDAMLASHDKSQPLCLVVASHSPHVYWPDTKDYDPAKINLPPYLLDTPETRAARCKYFGDVTHMDVQVGEVRASLERHGFAPNTLFMFAADQGAQFPFAKWNLYDAGIRVPLLVAWPGKVKAGTSTAAMVSLIDLLPTMMEAAGSVPPSNDLDGKSIMPVLRGEASQHDEATFAVHTGDKDMNRTPMRSIRTDRWKYILNLKPETKYTTHISDAGDGREYWVSWEQLAERDKHAAAVVARYRKRPAEELYDVASDPYELKNLADDPQHAKTLAELREKLKAWRLQQGEDLDKVPMPEDARHGSIPYAQ
jgi:N-sulfoglucosamine sulfohydrolase